MKPVTIAVSVRNPGFAEALAKGLAKYGNGYMIENLRREDFDSETKNCHEVLVTDFEGKDGWKGDFEPYRVVCVSEDTCRISWLTGQIAAASHRYREEQGDAPEDSFSSGKLPDSLGSSACRIAVFRSLWGGSGTTSLAVSCGRMLAGAWGERVLYLPLTEIDGSLLYRRREDTQGTELTGRISGKELFYRLKNRRPIDRNRYFQSDEWGLEYPAFTEAENFLFCLSREELKIMTEELKTLEYFDWILLDAGTRAVWPEGDELILTDHQQDSRSVPQEAACSILVRNHGLENRMISPVEMELIHDGESFLTAEDGRTEILLTKSYGAGIKLIADTLMERLPKSVEDW